jgi:hypothetical protein
MPTKPKMLRVYSHAWGYLLRNPFIKLLLFFLPISIINAPPLALIFGSENLGGLWMWRSLAWTLAYFLLFVSIQRMDFSHKQVATAIGWTAFICSIYAYLQFFGLDQFQVTRPGEEIGWHNSAPGISATIGSGFYLATFLAICLPFCVCYMRWWQTALVIGALLICQSDTATAGAFLTIVLMFCLRAKNTIYLKVLAGAIICILLLLAVSWSKIHGEIELRANGRFRIWHEVFEDWKSPPLTINISQDMSKDQKQTLEMLNKRAYALTGRGIGSFEFIFQRKHPGWNDPHNVYLRVLYELGLGGLVLWLGMIGFVLYKRFNAARIYTWENALYCAFFYCCFAGLTVPLLVVEPLRFYAVLMFSLLSI